MTDDNNINTPEEQLPEIAETETSQTYRTYSLQTMFREWYLDYASYSILDRAIPHIEDGFKPVQRRIMHSMKELEDGRFNKVANIVGNTMKYHPHGDSSIYEALVNLGQKDLLISCQGNWGNILTGDDAAAGRYIEARLSKFALEVAFNPKTTQWQPSYDGRNLEPITLPIKFPLLLAQGVEGISVGVSTKILPHNFNELLDASVAYLRNEPFTLYPDFPTGGYVDVSKYAGGKRGSKVRVRAKISQPDNKTLVIEEIPFDTTTNSLIESITKEVDKGRLKIKKIDDNTAANVRIVLNLAPGASPDQTIDALYALTDCEKSLYPNGCVIVDKKPQFLTAEEILKTSTDRTVALLKQELEIDLKESQEKWLWVSLEKIFIEHEIYEQIKPCKTDEDINTTILNGLAPYVKKLLREITLDDILKLRKIPIDRISKYNSDKANDILKAIEDDIAAIRNDLANLTEYAIKYFLHIKEKYGKGKERLTQIRNFENIESTVVAVANEKLYINRQEGFVGTGLKKDEYICDCSDIDDIIAFRANGTYIVSKVNEKVFMGENIIHVAVFKKNDERTIYNAIYSDGKDGIAYVKRFAVTGIIRDKEYDLTQGTKGSFVLYFSANPNGEAEKVKVMLKPRLKLKKISFVYDFSELTIKNKTARGNILSRNPVKRVELVGKGVSTLKAMKIWFDTSIQRLNTEQHGVLLGSFKNDDKILSTYTSGYYRTTGYELTNHFDNDLVFIKKCIPESQLAAVYLDEESGRYMIKRFAVEINDKKNEFLPEQAKLLYVTPYAESVIKIEYEDKKNGVLSAEITIAEFTEIMGIKAKGKKVPYNNIVKIELIEPEIADEVIDDSEDSSEEGAADIEQKLLKNEMDALWNKGDEPTEDDEPIEDGVQTTLF